MNQGEIKEDHVELLAMIEEDQRLINTFERGMIAC